MVLSVFVLRPICLVPWLLKLMQFRGIAGGSWVFFPLVFWSRSLSPFVLALCLWSAVPEVVLQVTEFPLSLSQFFLIFFK